MFNPALIRDAVRAAGLTTPVDVSINGVPYPGVNVKWWQPDQLYADGFSQQTDYHLEFWTEDLPSLKKGDQVTADGHVYEVADTPGFAIGKSGGHYSRVRLTRIARAYPKQPVNSGLPSASMAGIGVMNAVESILAFRVVRSSAGGAAICSNQRRDDGRRILGLSLIAATVGQPLHYQASGQCENSAWSWVPDGALYVGVDGLLTQTAPDDDVGAEFSCYFGFALTATRIVIDIEEPVYL